MAALEWIAVDWGTTNLRAWGIHSSGAIIRRGSSDDGMSGLQPNQFEDALLSIIGEWLPESGKTPVLACGMVGAKQGWIEAPYIPVPCRPGSSFTKAPTKDDRIDVFVLPGVSQSQPADVMRGEETQILGFLEDNSGWSGCLCLPGTHSKWVRIDKGEITSFKTFMTGEIFDALKHHTVLKHSMATKKPIGKMFETAISEALNNPDTLIAHLFGIRANVLLHDITQEESTSRLSGLIIGSEISAARNFWNTDEQLQILAPLSMQELYVRALTVAGKNVLCSDIDQFTLAGIVASKTLHATLRYLAD